MYNRLFTKILDSSIWLEADHTRLVWITFIAVMDKDNVVALSSIGNVAVRARVTEEQAAEAIHCLESPDLKNPDQDYEGRRIERIPGIGWYVINGDKYRDIMRAEEMRAQTRARVAAYRAREKDCNAPVTQGNEPVTLSDTDTTKEEVTNVTSLSSVPAIEIDEPIPEPPPRPAKGVSQKIKDDTITIYEHWKTVMNRPLCKLTKERKAAIEQRLKAGYTVEQIMIGIVGCLHSPNHNGAKGAVYNDIELICRNDTKLDNFIQLASTPKEKQHGESRGNNTKPSSGRIIANRPYRN